MVLDGLELDKLNLNMDKKSIRPLQITNKLLKLRGILDQIGQVSWSFSVLNKQYPINTLSEEEAKELILSYEDLIKKVINFLKSEYGSLENNYQP